jgi:hypothetical protein
VVVVFVTVVDGSASSFLCHVLAIIECNNEAMKKSAVVSYFLGIQE